LREFGAIAAWAQLRASGRQGSAIADTLIEFASQRKNLDALLEIAMHMAERVEQDWREFAQQCAAGVDALVELSA
jgi:uncharacterized protein (DUF2252 family)